MTERRKFLQQATGVAVFGAIGTSVAPPPNLRDGASAPESPESPESPAAPQAAAWDLSWASRLTGKHKAVFDVAEIESGFGAFRAAAWAAQYADVLKATPADLSPVIVLRAHAVVLALQQSFWDRYDVGRVKHVTHPVTLQQTSKNPLLLGANDGLPAPMAGGALPAQLGRGVTVLACNLALQSWIDAIKTRRKVSDADARAEAVAALVPGVILQPSGVFAATYAQQHGCVYLRAS